MAEKYRDRSALVHQIKKSMAECPLKELKSGTLKGLLAICKARHKANKRSIVHKTNAGRSSAISGDPSRQPSDNMAMYLECLHCKDYEEIKKGKLPKSLQHIHIIRDFCHLCGRESRSLLKNKATGLLLCEDCRRLERMCRKKPHVVKNALLLTKGA